jgi:hypothetical protein
MWNKYNSTLESQQKCFMVVQLLKGNSLVGREVFRVWNRIHTIQNTNTSCARQWICGIKIFQKNPENTCTWSNNWWYEDYFEKQYLSSKGIVKSKHRRSENVQPSKTTILLPPKLVRAMIFNNLTSLITVQQV